MALVPSLSAPPKPLNAKRGIVHQAHAANLEHLDARMRADAASPRFIPLLQETRAGVETACAAFHLNRSEQTLRSWACLSSIGPIRPHRVNGRLMWPVAELKKLCGLVDGSAA